MIQKICKWLVDLFRPERDENVTAVTITKEKEDNMAATYKAKDVTVTVGNTEVKGPLSLSELRETIKAREASAAPAPKPKPAGKVRMNHKFRQCLKSMGWGHITATHTTPQLHAAMSSLFNTPMRKEIKRAVFRKAFGK